MSPADHRAICEPDGVSWRCLCGKWAMKLPAVGPFGRTSLSARVAQVKAAHGKHARMTVQRGNLRQGKRNDNR